MQSSGVRVAVLVAAVSLLAGIGVVVVARATSDEPVEPSSPPAAGGPVRPTGFRRADATVDGAGSTHTFEVWVADDVAGRERGLMGVTDLGDAEGMAFVFPTDTTASFWMSGTPMALSVAFFDAGGALVSTADMAPCDAGSSCPLYRPGGRYRVALEVPHGQLGALGIGPGASFHLAA